MAERISFYVQSVAPSVHIMWTQSVIEQKALMATKGSVKTWTAILIKRLRGKRTQEEFARLLGAPKNTVWRWEAGYTVPTRSYSKKLSALAERERFLTDWQAVGSITWVGDLEAGT